MITTLTPEQERQLIVYRDLWIERGLSTNTNREKAELAYLDLYKQTKLAKPQIIWCPCPISGCLSLSALLIPAFINSSAVDSAVGSAVDSAVDSAVGSAVDSEVRSAVDSEVHSAVRSAVNSAVGSAVDSAVDSEVHSAVRSAVRSTKDIKLHLNNGYCYFGGSLWAAYQSYISYIKKVKLYLIH
jgi:hypothetical protein